MWLQGLQLSISLSLHSDCLLPIRNSALFEILAMVGSPKGKAESSCKEKDPYN
jgi:hypothetical protein